MAFNGPVRLRDCLQAGIRCLGCSVEEPENGTSSATNSSSRMCRPIASPLWTVASGNGLELVQDLQTYVLRASTSLIREILRNYGIYRVTVAHVDDSLKLEVDCGSNGRQFLRSAIANIVPLRRQGLHDLCYVHSDAPRQFVCRRCGASFSRNDILRRHQCR